ncbi:MAG: hybrid sensor histidine kinase/response regulator [Rhizobiaceae bacterium]
MSGQDLSRFSMRDLFRIEAEGQTQALTASLLALEKDPVRADQLEACMRAAHSLKGAARIVEIHAAVTIAHAMEDLFVLAQKGDVRLRRRQIDMLLGGVDLIAAIATSPDLESGARDGEWQVEADRFVLALADAGLGDDETKPAPDPVPERDLLPEAAAPSPPSAAPEPALSASDASERALRVSADNLNRLLDLAGESLVESRWLRPFGQSLLRLKRLQREAATALEALHNALPAALLDEQARAALADTQARLAECRGLLSRRLEDLETSDRQTNDLAHRLYDQALMVRMRPFADGLGAFPRMVRDIGRQLGKQARLDIAGERTQVDRDILEKLDAPLGHLLRNALDHAIETPDERIAAGKPAEGVIRIEAHHHAGALQITVSDDGRGIDPERIRRAVVARRLAAEETAAKLSDGELLEFLFLPGFTMKETVTEISGRGVGLDVVQDMVRQVRGLVRVSSQPGIGTRFKLELPLTLSIVRSLIVEIGGEPYAFPFAHVVRAVKVPVSAVQILEGRQHFSLDGQQIGLVGAHQVLGCAEAEHPDELPVILLGGQQGTYGLVVDRFLQGRELVVQPLDPRLGKIKDIAAAALMEDGSPLLIVDVEDMIRSMEKMSSADRLARVGAEAGPETEKRRKRVLVVDDSFTVRELQRKLLDQHGYQVEVAVDGMDGWNALRGGGFDLVVTDVDMPRIDGVELVRRIRQDPSLKSLPVMILSYKDREDDRQRGLEAGADYYLTKGSFQSDALIDAVVDLIGEAA